MGRSQRHKITVQRTDSAGKGLTQKQPANPYIIQYANTQPFTVPFGAPGGPLQGSSMAGFPPTLIPPPGLLAELEGELGKTTDFSQPGQFNLSGNPIYADLPAPDQPPTGPEPEPGFEPTLAAIDPTEAEIGGADLTLTCSGTNFTDTSVIVFNGGVELTEFVSDTELTTIVKPSTATIAGDFPVLVRQGTFETTAFAFTFTEPVAPLSQGRALPLGPLTILRVEDHAEGLAIFLHDEDVRVGDTVLVEATGNTSVNGSYTVLSVEPGSGEIEVIVDNTYELAATIEAKGRVTITSEA